MFYFLFFVWSGVCLSGGAFNECIFRGFEFLCLLTVQVFCS